MRRSSAPYFRSSAVSASSLRSKKSLMIVLSSVTFHLHGLFEASPLQTANECGYGNLGHFISEFRRQTGRTPLEYRKRYEEKHT